MPTKADERRCRFCEAPLVHNFINLGVSPLANSYLRADQLLQAETFYPLQAYVCSSCFLVQLEELSSPYEIFSDYAYFSSFSTSWLEHARIYATEAIARFKLTGESLVVEIGSNDGYLLRYFKEAGIPVLGIEPAENVAAAAISQGIETQVGFFNSNLAAEFIASNRQADLIIANNVMAHIPKTNDLMQAFKMLLKPGGSISIETPHLMALIEEKQFDTIYHEHYSYFSLTALDNIFKAHDLLIYDLERLSTHGGSLRIFAGHAAERQEMVSAAVREGLAEENEKGYQDIDFYSSFEQSVQQVKRSLLQGLIAIKEAGKSIAAYGAPAKGNTLLNYCGIGSDFIDYTVDLSPHKQGLFLPGSRLPIFDPPKIWETRPDYLLILPWNLKEEIMEQMAGIKEWGGRFIIPIPEFKIY